MKDINFIYGDLTHPSVIKDSIKYINSVENIFNDVRILVLEITSRKYILKNGNVYNNFYYNRNNNFDVNIIDDSELYSDLLYIKYLVRNLFCIEHIVVIPHIDIFLDDGNKIFARSELKSSLNKICKKLDINFLDINEVIEGKYFNEIAPDFLHYSSDGFLLVKEYINTYLSSIERSFASVD